MDDDDIEKKKSKRKAKKEEDLDEDVLPETGLYNPNGHLFYHASVAPLTKAQYKRAEEHGINLRSKRNFTLEECVQIFQNWKKFATENNIQVNKAQDYISVKKSQKHIVKHQEDNFFWVKLCEGLPHRSGFYIKRRAETMMTDSFMEDLDWSRLPEVLRDKYFQYEVYSEVTMQKMHKLIEKGYSSTYAAEILDVPVNKALNMTAKIRCLEGREDQAMMKMVFESALQFGLDHEKLRKCVITNNEFDVDRLRKDVKIDDISFKLHITEYRCRELLKRILKSVLKKFQEFSVEGASDDVAWKKMWEELFSEKPALEENQLYEALELMCKHVEKEDTGASLRRNRTLANIIKTHGISGFQCDRSENRYLHHRISMLMTPLNRDFFDHLRRDFGFQLKLHCLLWSHKKLEVWEKLLVPADKTRYETVLAAEKSNPIVSKLTLKFLKNEKVVEWISDQAPAKTVRNAATRRLEAAVESFILYIQRKEKFKFPAKLRHLVPLETSSKTIKLILKEILDKENSEYLSIKEVKKKVEEASGNRISMKLKNKAIVVRDDVTDSESNSEDNTESLVDYSRDVESKNSADRREEIENVLEKADPSKIRRKFRNREEEDEQIWLSRELIRQKEVMERAVRTGKNQLKNKNLRKFCSAEFIETSDESSSDEEKKDDSVDDTEMSFHTESDINENSDEPEDVETPEKKKKKLKHYERSLENSSSIDDHLEDSDKVTEKKKKRKRKDSEENGRIPEIEDAEEVLPDDSDKVSKKKKKKQEDSEENPTPEDIVEAPPDDSNHITRKKKKKRRHSEQLDDSEDVVVKKKKKNMNSTEDPLEEPEVPETEDDLTASHKKKKKKRHRDSEVLEEDDEEAVYGDSGDVKKKKRKHHLNEAKDMDDTESPVNYSEKVRKKKKKKDREAEDPEDERNPIEVESLEVQEDSEDVVKKKKKKKRRNSELLEDPVNPKE
uniref:Uncharacterized protein n=1 Tax=Caenorhabditis tropicalis TaxID=1561998 RepID=A0A1I7T5H9_9PELO